MKKIITEYVKLCTETDITKWVFIRKVSANRIISLRATYLYMDEKYYIFSQEKINAGIIMQLKKQRKLYSNEILLFNIRAVEWRRNIKKPY